MRALVAILAFALAAPALGQTPTGKKAEAVPQATPTPEPERPSAAEGGTTYVIQPRKFRIGHEFRLATGYLPMDAFYKGAAFDFGYGHHFGDFFSAELRGLYSWNHDTDMRRRLNREFQVDNDPFEKTQYMIWANFRVTPFHGKQVVLNRVIVHQELFFFGGPGGVGWAYAENGRSDVPSEFRPAVNLGAGFRWYLSPRLSVRLEAMENFYQKADGSIDDQIYVNAGLSISTKR